MSVHRAKSEGEIMAEQAAKLLDGRRVVLPVHVFKMSVPRFNPTRPLIVADLTAALAEQGIAFECDSATVTLRRG